MSSLLPVDVYIVVCEDGAAHRSYTDGLVAHAHLLEDLCNQLVHDTVATAGAVVHRVIVEQTWLLIDQVLWFGYILYIHDICCLLLVIDKGKLT